MQFPKKDGATLITVVITVIVIGILTTILIETSSDIPDNANYDKYIQEMKSVQTGIESIKIKNAFKGTTEEKLNAGFEKVYLEEAPTSFLSFGDVNEVTTGYLVNLETIEYGGTKYGNAYKNYESGDTLTFGKKEYDVFVYDAKYDVYYVKGLKYKGSMNYTF